MTDRRLNDAEVARARSYDDAATTYERVNAPIFFDAPAHALIDFAAIGPGERVLDVGAGTGAVSRAALVVHADPVAFDISTHMLLAAQRGGVSHLVCGALPELPFRDAVFDRVVSAFVLTHVDDADASVREMRRVLKPGGGIGLSAWAPADDVYTATCAEVVAEFIDPARVAEATRRVLPGEGRFSQPDGLVSLLEENGMSGVRRECRTFEFACSTEEMVASRAVNASGRALRRLLSDAEWGAYHARALEVLGRKFPDGIRYPRQVIFAAGNT